MRVCGVCGVNELIEIDELDTGMCRDYISSLFVDDNIDNFAG